MKAIVTGGAGFVGTNLIKELVKNEQHEVASIDDYSTGLKSNEQPGCSYYEGDISEIKDFGLTSDTPDIIFHIGARARIQPSFKNPQEVFENNVLGTQNVLNYARDKNVPVVYAGSSTAHGDHFANPYSFTKRQGELLCEMYNKVFKLPTVTTRFYNVYGEHQILEGAYAAVIGIFEKQYSDGKTLTVTGDGEQRRDFTHVQDIVDGLVRCGNTLVTDDSYKISGKTFELGRGVNYSINEITEMFGQEEVEYIPARPGEMRVTLCESVEARKLLGWNPTIDIKDYIQNFVGKN